MKFIIIASIAVTKVHSVVIFIFILICVPLAPVVLANVN